MTKIFERVAASLGTAGDAAASEESREQAIRRATAVLMIDVALADSAFDDAELSRIIGYARSRFGLDEAEAAELVDSARADAEHVVSLHEFTQLLHNNLDDAEKEGVIATLWDIAYADGNLDKYENSLVLKISDGLHVARGRCMRLKHDAAPGGQFT